MKCHRCIGKHLLLKENMVTSLCPDSDIQITLKPRMAGGVIIGNKMNLMKEKSTLQLCKFVILNQLWPILLQCKERQHILDHYTCTTSDSMLFPCSFGINRGFLCHYVNITLLLIPLIELFGLPQSQFK